MTTQEYLRNLHLNFICLCTHRCLTYEKNWPWYYIHNSSIIMPMSVSFWFHFLFFFPYSHLLLFVPYLHRIADEVYGVFVSTYEPHNRHLHSSLFCEKDKEHFIVITSHALHFHAKFLLTYLLSLSPLNGSVTHDRGIGMICLMPFAGIACDPLKVSEIERICWIISKMKTRNNSNQKW